MREKVTLVTGSSGEVGQALINILSDNKGKKIISLDIKPAPENFGFNVTISREISWIRNC